MKDYIVDGEQRLSPVVVITTVALILVFAIGILYRLGSIAV